MKQHWTAVEFIKALANSVCHTHIDPNQPAAWLTLLSFKQEVNQKVAQQKAYKISLYHLFVLYQ
ncbi:hypothetical protein C9J03_25585 [Photobacterium gaetbulicola]|nr:hypothetical protein C9J03_25585 [Photobacterium gaetbulicola]